MISSFRPSHTSLAERGWRDKLFEGGLAALAGKEERQGERLRRRIGQLERALGRKTYELEIAGEALRGWE